ncbi:M3 family oligoendopeptidase [Clostridium estertheticum]|uniref:M3 family oligoendopeptidase n=1 Tax=Clostridium estertheticum TaxID=238834 RepID=UPI0013E9203A|nr:M3 family oligoendopeptidase [Clostridium estertheticum]MBZ9685005.1 M3 family oligoendopeptidase [Clostridium estertheticum]
MNNEMGKWSLKELYSSFEGEDFKNDIKLFEELIETLINWNRNNLNSYEDIVYKLECYVDKMEKICRIDSRISAFCSLSISANASNSSAKKYLSMIDQMETNLTEVEVSTAKWISNMEDLEGVINSSDKLKEYEFYFKEIKTKSSHILSQQEEMLIEKMRLTGSSKWSKYRNHITANHKVEIELDGKIQSIGINEVKNMQFSKDGELRKKAYFAEKKSNDKIAEGVLAALNAIKGEVITLSEIKKYKSPLHRTLENSRMDEETLNVMIEVMEENLQEFQRYFLKKAELLGHKGKLPYYDIMAPVGNKNMDFTFEEARGFIVKHFSSFSDEMGELAVKAFDNRWIDWGVREGKRGGAFCSNLHCIKESRILCSYNNNFKNVCTLAHELGHAYHGMMLQKESVLNSSYPMPLAETASIFSETLVRNAALKTADADEALSILGTDLVNCSSVIVDIYARYIFEKAVFEKRSEGELSLEEVKDLMIWAQKKAYGDAISQETLDPFAWIHKNHYYYPDANFYNFPYAFGLLFSKGLYNMYLNEGSSFVKKYNELLCITGKSTIYDVAKSVDIDIHDKDFWRGSMNIVKKEIEEFCNS